MRLIYADALKRRAITVRFFGKDIMMIPTAEIDDAPTIDAVEVVRCKDCRHGEHIQIPIWDNRDIDKAPSQFHDFIKCHKFHIKGFNETLYLGDDDYCSWGERREP